jgi:hypothetical protein
MHSNIPTFKGWSVGNAETKMSKQPEFDFFNECFTWSVLEQRLHQMLKGFIINQFCSSLFYQDLELVLNSFNSATFFIAKFQEQQICAFSNVFNKTGPDVSDLAM